jgi:hypothetical protein
MRHPDLAEIAKMLAADSPYPEFCRHLAETCPECRDRVQQVEALTKRFGHWNPEVAVQEGLEADELFAGLLAAGTDFAAWRAEVERREELHTWAVAWLALGRSREQLYGKGAPKEEARDLALLAALIAENLGETYHPEWVSDLKATAYAVAAAAGLPGAESAQERLRHLSDAIVALENGTGDAQAAGEVWHLLSGVLNQPKPN